ncbi:MAG TPA: hypothetical protein VM163_00090 [bacterium]|nr:hypothetical protein [bacterium]
MDYDIYSEQVNYDGFETGGNRYRCQAMAIQQFGTELYVGVEGSNDTGSNRSEVWRSGYPPSAGSWYQVAEDGFGDSGNQHIDSAAVFNNKLYMGVCNNAGCQVWCTDGSEETGNAPYLNWTKVAENGFGTTPTDNCNAYCMTVFKSSDNIERLYVGTLNTNTGCEVWRTNGSLKDGGPEMKWEQVNYGGFGSSEAENEPDNICVMDMIVFEDQLYAGTWNTDHTQSTAGRIFRYTENGKDWTEVWDGNVGGNCYAIAARCFAEFKNQLYVGLFHNAGSGDDIFKSSNGSAGSWNGVCIIDGTNESDVIDLINFYDTNEDPPTNWLYATTGQGTLDYVWRYDGTTWEKRSTDGFGDDYNYSLFCMGTFAESHKFNGLFIGTWNDDTSDDIPETGTGTEIWQTPIGDCTYITLDSFEATARDDGSILLRWKTGTELGTAGFHLYRSDSPDFQSFEKITPKLIDATGTLEAGGEYVVLDRSASPGVLYYYFLVEIDVNGKMSAFGPVQARAKIPQPVSFEMYSAIIQMDTFGV